MLCAQIVQHCHEMTLVGYIVRSLKVVKNKPVFRISFAQEVT